MDWPPLYRLNPARAMSDLILPAPPWRRFAASIYDGLLLLGIWMASLLLSLPLQHALGLPAGSPITRAAVFVIGFGFFGWFWTRGGQTLGMRAWKLQVRRSDASSLRWPVALLRYVAMLAYWGLVLAPLALSVIARKPGLAAVAPHAAQISAAATALVLISVALCGADRRRRLPQDWLTGTEVVLLPRNPAT